VPALWYRDSGEGYLEGSAYVNRIYMSLTEFEISKLNGAEHYEAFDSYSLG
jgi:hypothetical protein